MSTKTKKDLNAYIAAFENLTPENLPGLLVLVAPDVHFKDPFNDVRGRDTFEAVFRDMFGKLDHPVFKVERSYSEGPYAVLVWTFTASMKGDPQEITGTSELEFAEDGLVRAHIDYWDAASQVYEKFPLIGPVLRLLKLRIGV